MDDVEGRASDAGAVAAVGEVLAVDVTSDVVADPPIVACAAELVGIGTLALTALFSPAMLLAVTLLSIRTKRVGFAYDFREASSSPAACGRDSNDNAG